MKKLYFFLTAIFIMNQCFSQSYTRITQSKITFQIRNMGFNVSGNIGGLQADIQFNPTQLGSSTIVATVDANTINTDNDGRDEHLKKEDYFDIAHYPKISLKSVSLKHKNGINYSGGFEVTIKGRTILIEIPFSYSETGNSILLKGVFKLNRLDFGIGDSSLILSNEVAVNIEIEANKP